MKRHRLQRVSCLRRKMQELFEFLKISDAEINDDSELGDQEIAKEVELAEHEVKLIPTIEL